VPDAETIHAEETLPAHRPITIDDLLTFRMGFGQLTEPMFDPPFPIVTAINERERWQYNAGSLVLGVLVARAIGAPLGDVLRTRLFEPLGMMDTGFWTLPENAGRIPSYYLTDFETGELQLQPALDTAGVDPATGVRVRRRRPAVDCR
jgi:CubicO group peptidase (beta-lactamase class C family)